MAYQESQEEEREVLCSIYDSDECFKEQSATSFTYRIGDVGDAKSFLVEVSWGEKYPDEVPQINLDAFYNSHLTTESKEAVVAALRQEAESLLGTPVTYSLFEFAKEHAEELVVPETPAIVQSNAEADVPTPEVRKKKEKKEVLSKQAKRKMADRTNAQGDLPRGWDWVDIVKHLSRTGSS